MSKLSKTEYMNFVERVQQDPFGHGVFCGNCKHFKPSKKHKTTEETFGGHNRAHYCHKVSSMVFEGSYCHKIEPTRETWQEYNAS